MFKKLIGFTALAGVIALGSGMGCSVTTVTSDGGTDTDGATTSTATNTGDGSVKPPVKPDTGPISCYDDQIAVTGFDPTVTAPTRGQGLCTDAQSEAIVTGCFGSTGSEAKCKAATEGANEACAGCAFGGKSKPLAPLVQVTDKGQTILAIGACAALVIGKPECALKVTVASACVASACSACEDDATDAACTTEAQNGACKTAIADAAQCNTDITAARTQWEPLCSGTTFAVAGTNVAKLFCGGATATDAGGGG